MKKKAEKKVSKKAESKPKKKVVKRKSLLKRKVNPELQKRLGIIDSICLFVDKNPQYIIIGEHGDFMILAKMVTLNISYTANSDGFQPVDRTEPCKKWIIFLAAVEEPGKWPTPSVFLRRLYDSGCQIVCIRDKSEIERKFGEV